MSRATSIVIALLMAAGPGAGQPARVVTEGVTVRLESPTTRKRLAEAQDKLRAGNSDEALRELQEILDSAGDDLVAPTPNGRLVPAHRVAFALIASLPPDTRRAYQSRVQTAAQVLLTKAKLTRDVAPLEELLTRYFPSRVTPEALTLLGDLFLERGDWTAAERTYARLSPNADRPGWHVPDAPADPAAVAARVALAQCLSGDAELAAMTIDEFGKTYPAASGPLGGRSGPYLETLKVLTAKWGATSSYGPHGSWGTVGGRASRDGRVDSRLPHVWPSGPTWRTAIPPAGDRVLFRSPAESAPPSAAHYPVVLNGAAYLADAGRVIRFDLATGRAEVVYDLRGDERFTAFGETDLAIPPRYDADFSLTVGDGRLYARLGTPGLWVPNGIENAPRPANAILRFAVADGRVKPDWRMTPPGPAGAAWQGTPAVAEGRVVAAAIRADGGRLIHTLVCYDHASPDPLWTTDVADSPLPTGPPRTRHDLVTLAEGLAIMNTNAGAVVAVKVATGKPAWTLTYPIQTPRGRALVPASNANHRDLAPAVAHAGTVFVAPTDTETLFAIDAASGTVLWEKSGLRTESILGVSRGKLVATLAGPVRGVRAFDARTGSEEFPLGWRNHDDPGLGSLGRGLVSDELILWPTRAGLIPLRPADGRLARPPVSGPHGNLAYAGGVLVVANPTEVLGYVIPEELRKPRPSAPTALPPPNLAIVEPPTVASSGPPKKWVPSPPLAPKAHVGTVPVPWASGVLPGDDRAGVWLVSGKTVASVDSRGGIGERLELPFVPTSVASDGGKAHFFSDGVTLFRPDTNGTFSTRDLALDAEPFGDVVVNDGIVAGLVGEHHLLALDAVTLRPKWVVDATGRPGYWPYHQASAPRFGPHFVVTLSGVVAQTDAGVAMIFDAGTGAVRLTRPTAKTYWPGPPAVLGDPGQESVILPAGTGHVARLDPLDGNLRWESRSGNESGLSGRSPYAKEMGGQLFVTVPRNHGVELWPTDADTGKGKWRRPLVLPGPGADLAGVDCDGSHLYVANGDMITATRLIDGRAIWAKPAAKGLGRVRLVAAVGGLIVMPLEPFSRQTPDWNYAIRSFARFPDPRRALGCLLSAAEAWVDRHLSLRVLDSQTGAPLAAINLRTVGPGAVIRFSPTGGVVATAGRVYLLK
jgi:outer membrane protein assembly factor BamB/TolA-binding protein